MLRFSLIFFGVLAGLIGIELLQPIQVMVIHPWTSFLAAFSSYLMAIFDPNVIHDGRIIRNIQSGFSVSIESGCNGVEAVMMLIAAIVAFPSSWGLKFLGIVLGGFAIQVANLVRIVTLYYLGVWNISLFEFAHLYLWQALIMLDILVVWLVWVRAAGRASIQDNHVT